MNKICLESKKYEELVDALVSITGVSEDEIKQTIEFLKSVLSNDMENPEYLVEKQEPVAGVMGFFIPDTKYYLSIKRGSLHLILLLMDMRFSGIPSAVDSFAGISKRGIWKIEDSQYCIVSEILRKEETTISELEQLYDSRKECCNRSQIWKCPFLSEENCLLKSEKVEKLVKQMIEEDLILEQGNLIMIVK